MLAIQTENSASPRDAPRRGPLLSIIVPTFNEHGNVRELVQGIDRSLAAVDWEIVFVDDDSADGTLEVLLDLSRADARVRHLQRIGRRGLASAVVEGILSTSAPYVAVMDADLQHDESKLAEMLRRLGSPGCDIVVGSRYMEAGGTGDWSKTRRLISDVATQLTRLVLRTKVSDPMSGFFMLKRDAFDVAVRRLSSTGYKILLDILVSAPRPLTVVEVPYVFRSRQHGESKLDSAVTWEFLVLLLDKTVGRVVPGRFVMFALVGGVGVFVHMLVLALLNQGLNLAFMESQLTATVAAMTFNFFANNVLTYRDKRLKGLRQLTRGLLTFYAVCGIGALSNVGIATVLFREAYSWWLAGLAGILVGAVWNYAASALFTWRK
jgi:dolichol-phosphate mannosyltransferase